MQATVWRDKKIVGFLHNHLVEPCADDFVERFSPRQKSKKKINAHSITSDFLATVQAASGEITNAHCEDKNSYIDFPIKVPHPSVGRQFYGN